jgi:serine/threonine-protein kinase
VTFISNRTGKRDLYVRRADGVGSAEPVLDLAITVDEGFWSPEGDWLIYRSGMTGEERDIFAWQPGPDSATVSVATAAGVDEVAPTLSPDGRWLAYVSNETGRQEVWVRPFPDVEAGRWQISVQGGTEPVWAHSGRELFYKSQGSLMVVGVQTTPTFAALEVRELFSTRGYTTFAVHRTYDVTEDDQRFVMIRETMVEEGGATELIVVENFFEELKERVGN